LRREFAIVILIFGIIFFAGKTEAIDITAVGSWSLSIDSADLVAGAGSDLKSDYESVADAVSISISATAGASDSWRVDVKKVDTDWQGNLILYIKRTSDGTGGSVSGGTAYQEVTDVDTSFFSGSDDVSGVKAQLKLSGVSIQVPIDTYTTTVYYTIVDI
jgi:hypothetical protein